MAQESRCAIVLSALLFGIFVGVFIGHQDVYVSQSFSALYMSLTTMKKLPNSTETVESFPPWETPSVVQDFTPLGIEHTEESWWEHFEGNRTIYIESITGLSNTLQVIASALTVSYKHKINVKFVFERKFFGPATWDQLFSFPKLDLHHSLPNDESFSAETECLWSYDPFEWKKNESSIKWATSGNHSEEFSCLRVCCWRESPFPQSVLWFYKLLRPSQVLQELIDEFKEKVEWERYQWIGVHIRRTDNVKTMKRLVVEYGTEKFQKKVNLSDTDSILPIKQYIKTMDSFVHSWATHGDEFGFFKQLKPIKFYLATDNPEARAAILDHFEEGKVLFYDHNMDDNHLRKRKWGMELAVIDLFLLASCKVTIGTTFSTFSEAAHMIGSTLYMEPKFKLTPQRGLRTWP